MEEEGGDVLMTDPCVSEKSNSSIGPYCDSAGITSLALDLGTEHAAPRVVCNAVVLELRSHWYKQKSTWRIFCQWLEALGIGTALVEDAVRQKTNYLYALSLKTLRRRQEDAMRRFLEAEFTPPRSGILPVAKLRDSCFILRARVGELKRFNLRLRGQERAAAISRDEAEAELHRVRDIVSQVQAQLETAGEELNTISDDLQSVTLEKERLSSLVDAKDEEIRHCKTLLSKWGSRNAMKRQKRRDITIISQKREIESLRNKLRLAERSCRLIKLNRDSCRMERCRATKRCRYYKRRCEQQHVECKRIKLDLACADQQRRSSQSDAAVLADENANLLEERLAIQVQNEGLYTDEMRATAMALCALGVGTKNIGPVVRTVAPNLFGVTFPTVPSESTCRRLLAEANIVGKIQVADTVAHQQGTTLHCDGTTDHQRHFFGWQVSTPTSTLCMALGETVGGDTSTQLEELKCIARELSVVLEDLPHKQQAVEDDILLSFRNLMTDQAAVNKSFREQLESLRLSILNRTENRWGDLTSEDKIKLASLNQWFCLLHVLLGLADAAERGLTDHQHILSDGGKVPLGREAVSKVSRRDGSAVMETVKAVCALLTASGHPSAGIPADFAAWMAQGLRKIHLIRQCHNRFNVTFHNAAAVWHHRHDIRNFLGKVAQTNQLIEAVRGDISDNILLAAVRGVAIFHVLVTAPYHCLVLSTEKAGHIMDMNPYLVRMQQVLEQLSSSPWDVIADKDFNMWPEFPSTRGELHAGIIPEDLAEEHLDITAEVLSMVSTHCLVTFTRQVSHQLPGGENGSDDNALREGSISVPKSNSIGESQFALLKHLRTVRPNAGVPNLEATIMWAYNKTDTWLNNLPLDEKTAVMASARRKSHQFTQVWGDRATALRQERLRRIKRKEGEKQEKEVRAVHTRQKNLDDVRAQSGQCQTAEDVDALLEKFPLPKERTEALKAQLRLVKTVLNPPGMDKSLLAFSKHGQQFPPEKLATNLKAALEHVAATRGKTETGCANVSVPSSEERQEKLMKVRKRVLCNYVPSTEETAASTCRRGRQSLDDFPANPVGMAFRHRWRVGKVHRWYSGRILQESPDEEPSFTEDTDANCATGALYRSFRVSYDGEEEEYVLRLEKDFCRGDVQFT